MVIVRSASRVYIRISLVYQCIKGDREKRVEQRKAVFLSNMFFVVR